MNKEIRLLDYLTRNHSITSLEAINNLGDTRLSATIFNLKHQGYNIQSCWQEEENRYGELTRFKRYFLMN